MKTRKNLRYFFGFWQAGIALFCLLVAALVMAACSSGNSSSGGPTSQMATVNTHLSDPATCEAPTGPFSHVYVTITDVKAHTSASAGANDSGWADLTPNMKPTQIDLLGQANNKCFLATLGDSQQLQAGNYQQIRLILAGDGTSVSGNVCGSAANCVQLGSDSSFHPLLLSSESKTGLKISSGQIGGGGFNIAAGQTKDLDIDFSTCESIVKEGNGQYRLKPVLHAGEVSTTSTSINGKVLDKATGNPVGGTVMVAVEQKDSTGVDRIFQSTLTGADGGFVFCPLPAGTYDVVIVGTRTDGVLYAPAIITGVSVGSTVGSVDLYLPSVVTSSSLTLAGLVTSQNTTNAATVADVSLSTTEQVNATTYTIPLPPTSTQSSVTMSVETAASTSALTCPANTDCAAYSITVPSSAAYIAAWSASGVTLALSTSPASYVVDGMAFVPGSGGSPSCNPSELQAAAYGATSIGPVQTLAFVQCQ
ncbi:DUF4382 domain-containing protein [Occallatibacter riparius]|uniref:DUF4382 domain-containing protein n=1 Tax=Occallatibacter riparius TaxID=1002689 RepID=A0A9J7BWR7_9BACT|nr:DUF4382 domain-containing protein [Occallatibacter riparius]UWZ85477.1 DUF4382 domain-containing protein [Occallatibacter riparius]